MVLDEKLKPKLSQLFLNVCINVCVAVHSTVAKIFHCGTQKKYSLIRCLMVVESAV